MWGKATTNVSITGQILSVREIIISMSHKNFMGITENGHNVTRNKELGEVTQYLLQDIH